MRRSTWISLSLALPALLAAADALSLTGWKQQEFEETCWRFVAQPERLPSVHVTPALRTMAALQRKGLVPVVGAQAKAYYASPAFQKRWVEHWTRETGGAARETQMAAAKAQQDQIMEMSIANMEQMIPMMPPEQKKQMEQALAKMKLEKAAGAKGGNDSVPKDPKVALRKALNRLLKESEGVDFGAALSVNGEGRRTFANPAYEAKSSQWKMMFRAGREPVEAVRAYVKAWLAELK